MSWQPSNPSRRSMLGLADPGPSGSLPAGATTADVLAFAVMLPGTTDPVEGMVDAVRVELTALADLLEEQGDILHLLARRLEAAMVLLRWTDNRERMLVEDAPSEAEGASPLEGMSVPEQANDMLDDVPPNR